MAKSVLAKKASTPVSKKTKSPQTKKTTPKKGEEKVAPIYADEETNDQVFSASDSDSSDSSEKQSNSKEVDLKISSDSDSDSSDKVDGEDELETAEKEKNNGQPQEANLSNESSDTSSSDSSSEQPENEEENNAEDGLEDEAENNAEDGLEDDAEFVQKDTKIAKKEKKLEKKRKRTIVDEARDIINDSRKLCLRNVSFDALEKDLEKFFEKCGKLSHNEIIKRNERSRGIAFVQFETEEGAKKALELNDTEFMGRNINISVAQPFQKRIKEDSHEQKELSMKNCPKDCKTIFIGNLSFDATIDDINEFFKDCGNIKATRVITSKETGESRGFGYVEFEDEKSLEKSLLKHGQNLIDRPIKIDFATSTRKSGSAPRGARRGRGRGRGRGNSRRGARRGGNSKPAGKIGRAHV